MRVRLGLYMEEGKLANNDFKWKNVMIFLKQSRPHTMEPFAKNNDVGFI